MSILDHIVRAIITSEGSNPKSNSKYLNGVLLTLLKDKILGSSSAGLYNI